MIRYAYYRPTDRRAEASAIVKAVLALGLRLRAERPEGRGNPNAGAGCFEDIRARGAGPENNMATALNPSERQLLFAAAEAMFKLAFTRRPAANTRMNLHLEDDIECNATDSRTAR